MSCHSTGHLGIQHCMALHWKWFQAAAEWVPPLRLSRLPSRNCDSEWYRCRCLSAQPQTASPTRPVMLYQWMYGIPGDRRDPRVITRRTTMILGDQSTSIHECCRVERHILLVDAVFIFRMPSHPSPHYLESIWVNTQDPDPTCSNARHCTVARFSFRDFGLQLQVQCRVAAVVLLGEAWSGKPGFESHRQPLCLFGGVGRKRLAPSSCTGGVHKGSVGDGFRAFPTGGCWAVV